MLKAEFEADEIASLLELLIKSKLQSDQRFAESYLHHRSQRGFGSQRIKQELKERGVDARLISTTFEQADINWFSLAASVRCKRFGEKNPANFKDRAKQQRFLQYRGFTHEQITESFNTESI